jgi:hypothetical protein
MLIFENLRLMIYFLEVHFSPPGGIGQGYFLLWASTEIFTSLPVTGCLKWKVQTYPLTNPSTKAQS